MRWIAERLFGWDDATQDAKFERQFVLPEVRIIVLHDQDVGYLQVVEEPDAVLLKELHVAASFQNRGIGTEVLRRQGGDTLDIVDLCRARGKPVAVGVVKFNPGRALYERLGFRIVGEDVQKFYLRRD